LQRAASQSHLATAAADQLVGVVLASHLVLANVVQVGDGAVRSQLAELV